MDDEGTSEDRESYAMLICCDSDTLFTVHEDFANDMWTEYLKIVDDYDKRLTDGWKDDANAILVFVSPRLLIPVAITMTIWETGLFSATVAAFIISSYPQLSPDTGSQTVLLLRQLSQQFAGFANGTHVQPESYPSSPPSSSIICANVLWLLSLLLSITSALFATLMQQWARVYIERLQDLSVPSERARVRSGLFFGTKRYSMHMRVAVEMIPTLLHLSVFLFYVGLVIFFFTIFKIVAIAILIFVGLFGLVYFTLTILPCLDPSCPYPTPLSSLSWYLWHTSFSLVAGCLRMLLICLYKCFVPYYVGDDISYRQRLLTKGLETIDDIAIKYGRRLKDGFRWTAVKYASSHASQDTDIMAIRWLFQLPALNEKDKIQKFVAGIPGETIVRLLKPTLSGHGHTFFSHRLLTLFRSCSPGAAGLTVDMRKDRLLVCLNAIRHVVKHLVISPSPPLLDDIRSNFANMALMRPLWADSDPSIRVTARSICALLARQLLRTPHPEEWELSWLQEVMGRPSHVILFNAFNNLATADNMNIDSFVIGVFLHQTDDLPNVQATSFIETLKVLMSTDTRPGAPLHLDDRFEERFSSLIQRIEQGDHEDRDNVVDKLRKMSSTTGGLQPQPSSL